MLIGLNSWILIKCLQSNCINHFNELSTKNGILGIEFKSVEKEEKLEVAVFESAAIRLRPIFMTSISTIMAYYLLF